MTIAQAINYLHSSGMTEEQIFSVVAAFDTTREDLEEKYCVNACKLVRIKKMIDDTGISHVFVSKKDTINDMLKTNINDIADVLVEMNNLIYAILEVVNHV